MLGFRQARKLEDIPFPHPYAQLVFVLLAAVFCLYPLVAAVKAYSSFGVVQRWLPALLTFITMIAYLGLHKMVRHRQ